MRCGVAVSLTAQAGQSEAIHSPEACARMVVKLTVAAVWPMAVVWIVAMPCWPRSYSTDDRPAPSRLCGAPKRPAPVRLLRAV